MNSERYEIRFQVAARRAIAERLPESVAAAVLEFCETALALGPRRLGKPLFGPLVGCHGARRGTYRVVYRIDEQAHVVEVLDIDHRADIYHRSLPSPTLRAAVGSAGVPPALAESKDAHPAGPDWLGAVMFTLGLLLFVLALVEGPSRGWADPLCSRRSPRSSCFSPSSSWSNGTGNIR